MNIDDKIAKALQDAGENIEVNEWLMTKIKADLNNEKGQRERSTMKKKYMKWAAVGAVLFMTSTAAYAVGNLANIEGHVNHNQDMKEPPSVSMLNEKVGYAPQYVEVFSNGWTFERASVVKNSNNDENGVATQEWESVDFQYTKKGVPNGNWVSLSASNVSVSATYEGETVQIGNQQEPVQAVYTEQKYKFVPPNYQPTEEDKIAEANGSLAISYGSSEIEEQTMRTLSWNYNGIEYQLITNYAEVDRNALLDMSEEILAAK